MLKAASKKRSNIDRFNGLRVSHVARRWRVYRRVLKGFRLIRLKKTEENMAKTKSLLIAIPLNGAYYGNQSLRHLRWFY